MDKDPRLTLSPDTLEEASRNAFPIVAGDARRRDRAGLLLGAGIALALGALTFVGMSGHSGKAPVPAPTAIAPAPMPDLPPRAVTALPPAAAPTTAAPATAPIPAMAQPAPQMGTSPVMVYDTSGALPGHGDGPTKALALASGAPGAPANNAGLNENEAFGSRMGGAGVETASARRLADTTNTVTQGTLIAAILETAIDSDLPGYVRAVVSQDVRSFDGKRVLVPRSSRLIGQYKSGLAAGQTRAYVMWTRLIRPDGVSVALASPAVEYSGRSGLSGEVDSHFFKRFGAATLLSVIGGLGAVVSSGTSVVISGSTSSAASAAVQRDGQIPPTIRVAQGQPIRVFTARDLDFSSVAP